MIKLEEIAKEKGFRYIYAHARSFLENFYSKRGYILIKDKQEIPSNFSTQQQPGVAHVFMRKKLV